MYPPITINMNMTAILRIVDQLSFNTKQNEIGGYLIGEWNENEITILDLWIHPQTSSSATHFKYTEQPPAEHIQKMRETYGNNSVGVIGTYHSHILPNNYGGDVLGLSQLDHRFMLKESNLPLMLIFSVKNNKIIYRAYVRQQKQIHAVPKENIDILTTAYTKNFVEELMNYEDEQEHPEEHGETHIHYPQNYATPVLGQNLTNNATPVVANKVSNIQSVTVIDGKLTTNPLEFLFS